MSQTNGTFRFAESQPADWFPPRSQSYDCFIYNYNTGVVFFKKVESMSGSLIELSLKEN
jgi:hypothetical protein